MTEIFIGAIISQRMMNLSNISKILQVNPRKKFQTTHSQNKWSFLLAKVIFQNK